MDQGFGAEVLESDLDGHADADGLGVAAHDIRREPRPFLELYDRDDQGEAIPLRRVEPHPVDGKGIDRASAVHVLPRPIVLEAVRTAAARIEKEAVTGTALDPEAALTSGLEMRGIGRPPSA